MEQKAFDLIAEKVKDTLSEQGFARVQDVQEDNTAVALYTSENVAYSVLFEKDTKQFHLRTCAMKEDGPDNEWKKLSTWGFDPEHDSAAYAASIGQDFAETLGGSDRKESVKQMKKKKKKDEDSTTDPLFLFNRLAGIFPELRAEIANEKATYGEMRNITFARAHVVSKMEQLARTYPESDPFKKMCGILNDLYANGDMDTRSLITIVLLNGISDSHAIGNIEKNLSVDLAKVYTKAKGLKGKKISPEKKKKKPKYDAEMMKTLNDVK